MAHPNLTSLLRCTTIRGGTVAHVKVSWAEMPRPPSPITCSSSFGWLLSWTCRKNQTSDISRKHLSEGAGALLWRSSSPYRSFPATARYPRWGWELASLVNSQLQFHTQLLFITTNTDSVCITAPFFPHLLTSRNLSFFTWGNNLSGADLEVLILIRAI